MPKASRLASEDSPYLRQSIDSLIDWHPWNEETFRRAERENRALFVSIGYFTCHWCSLMARDSFEREETARLMNENFINVKVDRFERPDLDRLYMRYMTETARKNGWPLNLWMTPGRAPFRGVIYMPSVDQGQGTFQAVAEQTVRFWNKESAYVKSQAADDIARFTASMRTAPPAAFEITPDLFETAFSQVAAQFDPGNGGFGRVPKFPSPARIEFLFRHLARKSITSPRGKDCLDMITGTLRGMSRGALRDHVGGGFFRYALDEAWRRPYFEKMIFDQAEAAKSYLTGYTLSGDEALAAIARETLSYADRELSHPEGGFYNAEHCESLPEPGAAEPADGAYYVWRHGDLVGTVGDAGPLFESVYDLRQAGNAPPGSDSFKQFTGLNLLYEAQSPAEAAARLNIPRDQANEWLIRGRESLERARSLRPRPALDRLVITQMNGAMISALTRASVVLKEPAWLDRALRCARFVRARLYDTGRHQLFRCCADRPARVRACAEDYAFLIQGLLDLYEASGDSQWLLWAEQLSVTFERQFFDREDGGFFDAPIGSTDLFAPFKNDDDAAGFCSNAIAALDLARLSAMLNAPQTLLTARQTLRAFATPLARYPGTLCGMTCAADAIVEPLPQIVIIGPISSPDVARAREAVFAAPKARRVILYLDPADKDRFLLSRIPPLADLKPLPNDRPSVYFCQKFAPTAGPFPASDLAAHLGQLPQ